MKDVAKVEIGHAPRLGQFGFNQTDDAVEGIVLMRTGEQAQVVLKRVEAKTRELNDHVLPKDVKVVPYYDRSDLVALTTRTVADNLIRGILLVVVVLIFFLYDIRSGLIVAVTVPLALLIAFICLDLRNIPANLLSIGAIDFGILVDGAVVMVENIYRQLAERHGTSTGSSDVLFDAASEVNRPIVYAIAVIVAGFLPIYALTGPSGKLFKPMADTTIFALLGSLFLTLTVIPVLCAIVLRRGVKRAEEPRIRVDSSPVRARTRLVPRASDGDGRRVDRLVRRFGGDRVDARRRVHAQARRRRALGSRDDALYDLVRRILGDRTAGSPNPEELPGGDRRRVGARPR